MKKLSGMFAIVAIVASLGSVSPARSETTECTEITSLPAVITVQGVYCFKQHLNTAITTGDAIDIQTNNVTIDMNGFKLGGLAAGAGTATNGIRARGRTNIVLRNGSIRGFYRGIYIYQGTGESSGHVIEDIKLDGITRFAIVMEGDNVIIRNNHIVNTGGTTSGTSAFAIDINGGSGLLITGNVISGVVEETTVYGMSLSFVIGGEVSNNRIFGLNAGHMRGINATNNNENVVMSGNVLSNNVTGNYGILNNATGGDCIGNTVRGFSTALSSCDFSADNYTP